MALVNSAVFRPVECAQSAAFQDLLRLAECREAAVVENHAKGKPLIPAKSRQFPDLPGEDPRRFIQQYMFPKLRHFHGDGNMGCVGRYDPHRIEICPVPHHRIHIFINHDIGVLLPPPAALRQQTPASFSSGTKLPASMAV